jgi:hypothetical protein
MGAPPLLARSPHRYPGRATSGYCTPRPTSTAMDASALRKPLPCVCAILGTQVRTQNATGRPAIPGKEPGSIQASMRRQPGRSCPPHIADERPTQADGGARGLENTPFTRHSSRRGCGAGSDALNARSGAPILLLSWAAPSHRALSRRRRRRRELAHFFPRRRGRARTTANNGGNRSRPTQAA